MKWGFYPRLAWQSIRKNRRLYFPYILTGCVMVMMYYILSFLMESPALQQMKGGGTLSIVLPLGCGVIAIFSLLFLFYTNSFLIRQRYREFGLYNILGMDKWNICRLAAWETLFVGVLAVGLGLFAGVTLSKLAELGLLNLLHMEISYDLRIGAASMWQTAAIFGGIYLLLLVHSVLRISRSKPLELMESSKVGERVPKRTWLYALLGIALLAMAYYLAVTIQEPLTALLWFFIAVIMVILGTYLVFIAGSVVFCKLLQKNRAYYYRPNHFVSVAAMVYRMKRNGAGLASICILLTMVLVMISSTTSLYFGSEDSLKLQYPNGVNISLTYGKPEGIGDENLRPLRAMISGYSGPDADLTGVRACEIPGLITQDGITVNIDNAVDFSAASYDNVGYLSVISLSDYNRMTGKDETLGDSECFVYCDRLDFQWDTFTMEYGQPYQVKQQLDAFTADGDTMSLLTPTVYLVVKDLAVFIRPVQDMKSSTGDPLMVYDWRCGFDVDSAEDEIRITNSIFEELKVLARGPYDCTSFGAQSREAQRAAFYDVYGSLLFLGIMLSTVFLLAAVLIIYYKQISEGYEDHARFEIMRKVGMTRREIRRSVNSQMLTVFFLPLLFAGIHLAFAFPFITKIFKMFAFDDPALSICVNLGCFGAFGVLYAAVYKITSNVYCGIVSGAHDG